MQTTQTTKAMQTTKRPSREAQRNAKVQAAYESIRDLGRDGQHHLYSVASGSLVGMRYLVTRDETTGRMHCSCLAGQHERSDCAHRQAVDRWVLEHEEKRRRDHERDTALLRRSNQPFSLMK